MEEVKGGTDGHASSPQTHVASSAAKQFSQDLSSLLASVFSAIVGGELKCCLFFFFLRRCIRDIELTLVRLHAMLISKHNDLEICLSLRCCMCNSQPASLYLEYLKSIKLLKIDTDCMNLLRQCLYFLASNLDGQREQINTWKTGI